LLPARQRRSPRCDLSQDRFSLKRVAHVIRSHLTHLQDWLLAQPASLSFKQQQFRVKRLRDVNLETIVSQV
jgi:hypothetical protein